MQDLIDSGGDVGEDLEGSCVPGLIAGDLLEIGEVVGTISISCSTQRSPLSWIGLILVMVLMRRSQHLYTYKNKKSKKDIL